MMCPWMTPARSPDAAAPPGWPRAQDIGVIDVGAAGDPPELVADAALDTSVSTLRPGREPPTRPTSTS
jgi:hypothetical protein